MQYRVVSSNKVCWENLGNPPFSSMILPYRCFCLRTENRARKTHVFWGGGGHVNAPCTSYIIVGYAAKISGVVATWHDSTLLMGWGWVGGACQRSLYFVHQSVLRCKDLWDRCYITCYHAAEISGVVATWHDSTLLMGWGGVGGACQGSLYFVH